MARAATLAATTRDRQLVAIAAAHLEATPIGSRTSPETTSPTTPTAFSSPGSPPPATTPPTPERTRHEHRPHNPPRHRRHPPTDRRARYSFRPWYRWLLTALAFPPSGLIAHLVAGRVDSVPAAVLNGVIAGAGIGAAQWALLRHRGVSLDLDRRHRRRLGRRARRRRRARLLPRPTSRRWRSWARCRDSASASPKARRSRNAKRTLGWIAANAALWALGWTVTTAGGIDVSQQWAVFGAYGCLTLAFLQSTIIGAFVPGQGGRPS